MLSLVETSLKLFIYGLSDSLSLYRTIPTLVNNHEALLLTVQILGANGLLILGSVFLFQRGILPMVDVLGGAIFDWYDQSHYNSLLWLLYQSLWLVPICGLCYACSTVWYQSLADAICKKSNKKQDKKKDTSGSGLKSIEYAAYATISWLFVFVQVQLLTNYIPNSFAGAEFVINKVFAQSEATAKTFLVSQAATLLLHLSFLWLFRILRYVALAAGLTLMSALYAWYAFDPKWISDEVAPDERFAIMEQHLPYFLGFGLPFVLLNKMTSFFVGFGGFMMIFPFCIILGTVTDYTKPFRALGLAPSSTVVKFRIFKPAEVWTLFALKYFGQKIVKKADRKYRQSTEKSAAQSSLSTSDKSKPATIEEKETEMKHPTAKKTD